MSEAPAYAFGLRASANRFRSSPISASTRAPSRVPGPVVREAAVPLPGPLAALLVEMADQLTATAADAPLAALRAAGVLERIAARVSRAAAGALCDDGLSAEAVATALGTTTPRPWSCS
ncbi:hypothetical protein [Streptomyces sp. NBC_00105]|uniref:hypothetical protein n=1 Tax=unclassified Streptomyces TaxID=2593676 RepID=UPI002888D89A|nr:hypothetical protein [Streptomyces sp. DSM 41633]